MVKVEIRASLPTLDSFNDAAPRLKSAGAQGILVIAYDAALHNKRSYGKLPGALLRFFVADDIDVHATLVAVGLEGVAHMAKLDKVD